MTSFHEHYQSGIERHSESPFLVWYGMRGECVRLSFAEFDQKARDWAESHSRIMKDHSVVAIAGGNTPETLVAIAGALVLGKTLCPFDPTEGADRIREKASKLGEKVGVWVDPRHEALLRELGFTIDPDLLKAPDRKPMVLVFTSGSTGYSKAVEQPESGILANVHDLIARHRLGPGRRLSTPLPIFHVNALEFSFLSCLLSGATLILFESFIPEIVIPALEAERAQILSIVPTLVRVLVSEEILWKEHNLSTLEYLVTAAAPLSVSTVLRCREILGKRIIQGYGLSEAVNFSCLLPTDLSEEEYLHWMGGGFPWPSIGTALGCNEVTIRNDEGVELPEGAKGEVCIRGPNVMNGYRGEGANGVIRDSWLYTGDLGMFAESPRGRFYFITGRRKETVKRHGATISLREIDDVLSQFEHPGFDAIAVPFENEWSGEEVGVAARIPSSWREEDGHRLVLWIEKRLPEGTRPGVILFTNEPLRTASGKPKRWPLKAFFQPYSKESLGTGTIRVVPKR